MIAQVALDAGADVEKIKAAKVGGVTVETAICGRDRHHRREHDAAPRRRARVGEGVVASYVHNAVHRRPRQDRRDGRAGVDRQDRRTRGARPPDRDACRVAEPAGARSGRRRSRTIVKREKDVLADKYRQQGKPENVIEKIVEIGPEDLLQGSHACWSRRSSSTTTKSVGPGAQGS